MKTLTIKKTTHNGYQVVLKQDVDTDYESVLEVEFFDTKRKVKNLRVANWGCFITSNEPG